MKRIIYISMLWFCCAQAVSPQVENAWWELQSNVIILDKIVEMDAEGLSTRDLLGQFTEDGERIVLKRAALLENIDDIICYLDGIDNKRIKKLLAKHFRNRVRFEHLDGVKIASNLTLSYGLGRMPQDCVSLALEELNLKRPIVEIEMQEKEPNLLGLKGQPVILKEASACMPYSNIVRDILVLIKDVRIRKALCNNYRAACAEKGHSTTLTSLVSWNNGDSLATSAERTKPRSKFKPVSTTVLMDSAVLVSVVTRK